MKLVELFKTGEYDTDKGDEHSYLPIYDELFEPFKDKEINLLEIGYKKGGSCKLWADYFPKANIMAIDNWQHKEVEKTVDSGHSRIKIVTMDSMKLTPEFFKSPLDIAIDDGCHKLAYQIAFIKAVFPVIKEGGILIVEDIENIDVSKKQFDALNMPYELVDKRKIKNRADDVLLIFRK